MKKVLFTQCTFSDDEIEELEKSGVKIIKALGDLSEDQLIQKLQGCWGYICGGSEKATEKILKNTNLYIYLFLGTGYQNHIDVKTATKHGVIVTSTPHANAYTVAEYAIAHILNAVKKITDSNNKTKNGMWDRNRTWLLKGKTLGIIGMGHIGTHVAEIMHKAFDMRILYVGRSRKLQVEKRFGAKKVKLQTLMKDSDVVTIHASYGDDTINLIGAKELSLMKPHAVLVNCSRAEMVNPKALLKALKTDKIATASYDAYYKEPAPEKSQDRWGLLSLPDHKFIITPHTGYNTKEAFDNMNSMLIESLLTAVNGNIISYRVN